MTFSKEQIVTCVEDAIGHPRRMIDTVVHAGHFEVLVRVGDVVLNFRRYSSGWYAGCQGRSYLLYPGTVMEPDLNSALVLCTDSLEWP